MHLEYDKKQSLFTFFKFILPSIFSMVFISFYSAVDSYYIAQYVSTDAMAAVNIVLPFTNLVWGLAVMLAAGSSALIGIKLGEGKREEADQGFSLIFLFLLALSTIVAVLALLNIDSIIYFMGATDLLYTNAKNYLFFIIAATPILVAKLFLEYYIRLDGHPAFALFISFIGLILNIIFNHYTIVVMGLGVVGASFSTVASITASTLLGVMYFLFYSRALHFTAPQWDTGFVLHSLTNGSSEMLTEISSGIVGILFNITILRYAGENGVAAMAVVINIFYFLVSIYLGIAVGAQPLISYNYGAQNKLQLQQILVYCRWSIIFSSVVVFLLAQGLGSNNIHWYLGDNPTVVQLAIDGFRLFAFCFLFLGVNVFMSGLYTAIGNGKVSALISLARSLIFVVIALVVLPKIFGLPGVWWTIPVAEAITMVMSLSFYYLFVKTHLNKTSLLS
ncbi:MAG: MATE family efflux transporter [Acidaminococcaceae bacterium]